MSKQIDNSGWVLISQETDEFYGKVQWRNKNGVLTNKKQTVELFHGHYVFCQPGLGKLVIVK